MRYALRVSALLVLLGIFAIPVLADEGDTRITDPDLLTRLGFPAGARNLYLAKGAILDQQSTPAQPKEYGTEDFGWTTINAHQHHPLVSDAEYDRSIQDGSMIHTGGSAIFEAQLHMPSGALFEQVAWFGVDDDSVGGAVIAGSILRVCQAGIPPGPPVYTVLGSSFSTAGDFVFVVFPPAGETVNNLNCAYIARSSFNHSLGGSAVDLKLRKIRAGWQRQVSPEPATATFPNDTPITHPYFRFIEALARSGITAGCAPGSFCPNSPITRGEMAVFLAAALGLHFPT